MGMTRVCSKGRVKSGLRVSRTRAPLLVSAVAMPTSRPPSAHVAKRSKVELIKQESDFLRHPLMEELVTPATSINEASMQLMKFHGSYMQDDRDMRKFGAGKNYSFMMRTRQPAGQVSNQLYLTMDDLADQYGNGSLRLTTRQAYQLHGVLKVDLKTVFSTVVKNMGSTLGACGDVNRNVTGPAIPYSDKPEYKHAVKLCDDIADLLAPQAGAYYDVWLDGEKFMSHTMEDPKVTEVRNDNSNGTNFVGSPEPIYGTQFLPRKFKVGVTVPGDNSIDILTNDAGVVVITNPETGELEGANIYAGGGMGRSHRAPKTFPTVAQCLGYVEAEDILYAIKAITCTQRDYGRRDDRKQSRLKYLIHEWGLDKFRSVTEQYFGKRFKPAKELPEWTNPDYMGWGEQGDGKLYYGVFVQNGRLRGGVKKALRRVIEDYKLSVRLTPHQNLILCDIEPAAKEEIGQVLSGGGVIDITKIDLLHRNSMACPAMPLCGLAIGEAERGLPEMLDRLRVSMQKTGLKDDESFMVRMTGCPNGCARPYMAELGFVGDGPNSYQVWLGGSPGQTRLAELFMDGMKIQNLEDTFEPIFKVWKEKREGNEALGDFVHRFGFDALKAATGVGLPKKKGAPAAKKAAAPPPPPAAKVAEAAAAPPAAKAVPAAKEEAPTKVTPTAQAVPNFLPRVMVDEEAFALLQAEAEARGTTLGQLATEAIMKYLK